MYHTRFDGNVHLVIDEAGNHEVTTERVRTMETQDFGLLTFLP